MAQLRISVKENHQAAVSEILERVRENYDDEFSFREGEGYVVVNTEFEDEESLKDLSHELQMEFDEAGLNALLS